MEYKLMVRCGFVNYVMKQKSGTVGSKAKKDSAEWILAQNKPFRSTEIENYPIAVRTEHGDEYFFEGVWPEPKKKPTRRKKVEKK